MIPLSFVTLLVPIIDFICTLIAPLATTVEFYEIKPALLNLVMKDFLVLEKMLPHI